MENALRKQTRLYKIMNVTLRIDFQALAKLYEEARSSSLIWLPLYLEAEKLIITKSVYPVKSSAQDVISKDQ